MCFWWWDMSATRPCEVGGGGVRGRRRALLYLRSSRRFMVTVTGPSVLCGVGEGWIPQEGREGGARAGSGWPLLEAHCTSQSSELWSLRWWPHGEAGEAGLGFESLGGSQGWGPADRWAGAQTLSLRWSQFAR